MTDPTTTLFVYGRSVEGDEEAWLAGMPYTPAVVRGELWLDSRRRPALFVRATRGGWNVPGRLVEVDAARLRVLDLVHAAFGGLERRPVRAASRMQVVPAQAWVLPRAPFPSEGWRRMKSPRSG